MPLSRLPILLMLAALASAQVGHGQPLTVPIELDYRIVQHALGSQLFSGPEQTALLYTDTLGCNSMVLSNPQLAGTDDGKLRLQTNLAARGGTQVGDSCLQLFAWSGVVETLEEAYISADGNALAFRVVASSIRGQDGGRGVPGLVWERIREYVQPSLEGFTLDLRPLLNGTRGLLLEALPGADTDIDRLLASVRLSGVETTSQRLTVSLALDPPELPMELAATAPGDVLSEEELARWDSAWQSWDAFATWLLKTLGTELAATNPELTRALADILLEARYDLRRALEEDSRGEDPVRGLFISTWERLAPLLREHREDFPATEALQYLAFISAGDALRALDAAAAHYGLQLDSATFRALARLLMPGVGDRELEYSTAVDPALRSLLGFDPQFTDGTGGDELFGPPFAWLVAPAQAAPVDPKLLQKLTGWVPKASDLDTYLAAVNLLLQSVVSGERDQGKVPLRFIPIYEHLILATAWQESCWRQYVSKGGQVLPLRSSAGSVGMMQVNQHVWRGVYDPLALNDNIAYNARAGNEILVHYLVDHAIRKKEHEITGDDSSVARAAYAVYNGGPRHLSRYRVATTSAGLKRIDNAFWKKYQAIEALGPDAVKACYAP